MVDEIKKQFKDDLQKASDKKSLENLRVKYLGRKGKINKLLAELKKVKGEERVKAGRQSNELKKEIEAGLKEEEQKMKAERYQKKEWLDVTAPGAKLLRGHLHPRTQVLRKVLDIFISLGFSVVEGPELETQRYNFEALNMPPHHPARDMQDTFYLENGSVLRTHTSPVQIRTMLSKKPPIRIICPGRTFRCDWDITHTPNFYQVEGLMIDVGVSLADMKGTIDYFCRQLFSTEIITRLRPSYFPFVEPGAEVDIQCQICKGKGCRTCKNAGWLEIMGAGMVHVNVLENVGIDSEIYTGFAFGMGMDRIAMLKFGIEDTRANYEGNLRFIEQFRGLE